MPHQLNIDEAINIIGNIGKHQIHKSVSMQFSEYGLKITITPNGHGAEFLYIYCLTETLFGSALYQENQLFHYNIQSNDTLASYDKTEDVREGVLLGVHFNQINTKIKQENNMIYCQILLEKYFDEPYMNPLYPQFMMVEQGNFKIDLTLHIPIKKHKSSS